MEVESFLSKEQIVFLENNEKQLVIRELLAKLEELGKIESSNRFYTQVIHRESLENTGIGRGFAIPHARTDSISEFITIFGIYRDGIDYQSYDNIPVQYVLLSIFPTEASTKYLYLIGMMSRIFSDEEKVKLLSEATTQAKIYSILKKEFKAHFEGISSKNEDEISSTETLAGVPSSDLDLLIQMDRLYHLYDEGDKSDSILSKIDRLKQLIDNRSLTYYQRMRSKCQNPFSIIEKNSCSGCHLEIPSVYLKKIKDQKGISVCNHCGRFLISL